MQNKKSLIGELQPYS